jgi:hypothetical protein
MSKITEYKTEGMRPITTKPIKPEPKPDRKGTVFIGPDRKITGWRFKGEDLISY